MSAKQLRFSLAAILILTAALAGLYFVSARTKSGSPSAAAPAGKAPGRNAQAAVESNSANDHARVARVLSQLGAPLRAIGDRVERPGKERLTLNGTLQRASESQGTPFVATYEQPGRLRLQYSQGLSPRVITFNGQRAGKRGGGLTAEEEALVETLVYDTQEGFLNGQMDTAPTHLLGLRFRTDDGTSESYRGSYYDIYQVTDRVKADVQNPERTKLYLLNSDTHLLEFVRYQVETDGAATQVEVRLEDWRKVQDQMFPTRLVRLENNRPVFTLTITSVALGPKAEEDIFTVGERQ
ncbi:MAG TPA: hypothetical protein VGC87_11040 [Pyrinomonadaceae bacterium]|jgi:hypothetical protein